MALSLREVSGKADLDAFIGLPFRLYAGDPVWVPPLRIAVRDLLDPAKNPFFKHARMKSWLAYRDAELVGRVSAVVDDAHNEYHDEKTAFFGFFECVDSPEVAHALLDAAAAWARAQGMTALRGPMNPSTNHECGLLVEGFTNPPSVMMTYNPPYYGALLEGWGLAKSKDLLAFEIHHEQSQKSDKLVAQAARLQQGGHVTFRPVDMKRFDEEIELIQGIYNDAWEKNWGFVPMNREEFHHLAKDLKLVLDPRLLLVAEVKGKPAGFALTLPDVNQAQTKVRDGRLFPFGLAKLLWNLKGPGKKRTINRCRILTLGIKKEYREAGIGPLLYLEYFKRGPALGYPVGEASWILEDNRAMLRAIEHMGGKRTKTYRLFDKAL